MLMKLVEKYYTEEFLITLIFVFTFFNLFLKVKSRVIVGYFDRKDSQEYLIFRKVATNLKDDCRFYAGVG